LGFPTSSAIRSRSGGDYLFCAESRNLGRSEPRFLQNFGIVLAHARRPARNTGALPVGAELDRHSGQTDLWPLLPPSRETNTSNSPPVASKCGSVNKSPGLPTGAQETLASSQRRATSQEKRADTRLRA